MSINYNQCLYMNGEKQNANVMLNECINGQDENVSPWPCVQREALDNDIFSIVTERPLGDNTDNVLSHSLIEPLLKETISTGEPFSTDVEGFTNMGEKYIRPGDCPDGYYRCPNSGKCIQVCMNCKYNQRTYEKSKEFNEADPCFPNKGVYAGIDNLGYTRCTCGQKNQYCGDNFNAQGGLLADKLLIMNVGDYSSVVNFANY
jgi:hypothetical protein